MPKKNKNGRIVWEGPSQLDGEPIVLILSSIHNNQNRKTGSQLETYILRKDLDPTVAANSGADYSICGDCWRKRSLSNTCYVLTGFGPRIVYEQYKSGKYDKLKRKDNILLKYKSLRLGSYGDPYAVPIEVWKDLLSRTIEHTGFTEKWKQPGSQVLKGICQASCSSITEQVEAAKMGWKTYTSLPVGHPIPKGLIACPYSKNPELIQCGTCNKCSGDKSHIYIYDHGAPWKQRTYVADTPITPNDLKVKELENNLLLV